MTKRGVRLVYFNGCYSIECYSDFKFLGQIKYFYSKEKKIVGSNVLVLHKIL